MIPILCMTEESIKPINNIPVVIGQMQVNQTEKLSAKNVTQKQSS